MSDELTFTYAQETFTGRNAFRTSLPGITVRCASGDTLDVKDISINGFSLVVSDKIPRPNERMVFDLYVGSKLFLNGLNGHLVRIADSGIAAYSFVSLTSQQEQQLDKLILTIQKRIITQNKSGGRYG